MTTRALSNEEMVGLALAALGHVLLLWVLVTARPPAPLPPVERVSVTLSDETGAISTAPNPQSDPVADKGPELGEPAPAPEMVVAPQPVPQPKADAAPPPRPVPAPPRKAPPPRPQQHAKAAPPKVTPAKAAPPARAGASILDSNYSKGLQGGSAKGKDQTPPATRASAQVVASWDSSIKAKVTAKMSGCAVSGLESNKLRASVAFDLNKAGGIDSINDFVVTGLTDSNRTQARPFKDCVIRAIKLAAPFTGMPVEFYDQWKLRKLNFSGR
jgi:outer membrane biosynthesis protein TonB